MHYETNWTKQICGGRKAYKFPQLILCMEMETVTLDEKGRLTVPAQAGLRRRQKNLL